MKTIVVVEDEPSIAEVLMGILEDAGYQVDLAINGQGCLDYLASAQPDLILSDLTMPVLDGLGLCRALRAQTVYASIPFVLMSATRVEPTADCPFDAIVTKPFLLHELLATVASLLA